VRSFSARSSGRSFAYTADLSTILQPSPGRPERNRPELNSFCSLLVSKEPSTFGVTPRRPPCALSSNYKCRILWAVCRLRVYAALRFIVSINILVPPPLLHTIWLLPLAAALIKLTLVRPQIATHKYIWF
jgi:hypothetical protein